MKKLTAILLSALIAIGCMSIMAINAAEVGSAATITADGKEYEVNIGGTFIYTVELKTQHKVTNGEFYLGYPQSILSIADSSAVDFPVIGKNNVVYNFSENVADEFRFNFSNQSNPYDFTNGGVLLTIPFTVTAAGRCEIGSINDTAQAGKLTRETVLSWIDTNYVINDELPNSEFTTTVIITDNPTSPPDSQDTTPSDSQDTTPSDSQDTTPSDSQDTTPSDSQDTTPSDSQDTTPTDPQETTNTEATEPSEAVPVAKDIKTCVVSGIKTKTYTGKAITQSITVKDGTKTLKSNTDYKVTYKNNKTAGTATITITGIGSYTGFVNKTFKISKAANPMTVKAASKAVKYRAVKSKAQTVSAISVKKAQGKVSYKAASKSKLTVNSKTGKITVKKGTNKGAYTIKVKVTAAGTANYNSGSKTVTVKVKVK